MRSTWWGVTIRPNRCSRERDRIASLGKDRPAMSVNIQSLVDDARCYETVRTLRWPDGIRCPHCDSLGVTKQGRDDTQPDRQRYERTACRRRFDDLTGTVFAGHHQPLRVWVLFLYFM